ncbi:MAG: ABC transporter ATP-binding protein, partial [Thermoleophilaceae bacterium]|nr:ABC transporter ATP-binding protein [Thermoleophilaceae bacterium]
LGGQGARQPLLHVCPGDGVQRREGLVEQQHGASWQQRPKEGHPLAHAAPLFERFGLADFERARPAALSGGMRQRVAFLRTLLAGRAVLLLDEPFASLDAITRADMQEWLAGALAAEPRTVVLVTHDVEEALFLADRVVILGARPGHVVAELEVCAPRPRPRSDFLGGSEAGGLRARALEALR